MTEYTQDFYDDQSKLSYLSAQTILPLIFEYVQPLSVLDVGLRFRHMASCVQRPRCGKHHRRR